MNHVGNAGSVHKKNLPNEVHEGEMSIELQTTQLCEKDACLLGSEKGT